MTPAPPADTGVVLLPQTGEGLCGWLPYAAHLRDLGMVTLSLDACGYGQSSCDARMATSPEVLVDVASRWLRRHTGVTVVVLVGASMGGSQTVRAVAAGADVQRWIDISGPSAWDGVRLLDVADRVDRAGLVIRAKRDRPTPEFSAARRLAKATGARFIGPPAGHGWDLVTQLDGDPTRLGEVVARFAADGP